MPESLLTISNRLFVARKSWSNKSKFDPEKNNFYLELQITDELGRFGTKNIATIKKLKNELLTEELITLFNSIINKANFPDQDNRKKNEKNTSYAVKGVQDGR